MTRELIGCSTILLFGGLFMWGMGLAASALFDLVRGVL